jgi:DNA modification methylase
VWIIPKPLHPSVFALDTEGLISDLNESSQLCASSLTVRSKLLPLRIWSRKWKRDSWTSLLSGRILKPSLGPAFEAAYGSSLAAIPVSPLAPQDCDSAKTIPAISGPTSLMESELFSLSSASSKTSKDTSRWDSPQSLAIWKKLVIEWRSEYSARLKSAQAISASASSSWPTASARDWKDTPGMSTERDGKAMGRVDQLARAVYATHGLPVPESLSTNGNLPARVLNPRWVETLMGLPIGWTMPSCVHPVTIELTSFDSLEMESPLPALNSPSSPFSENTLDDNYMNDSTAITCLNETHGKNWSAYHGDAVEVARQLPDESIHFTLYSPPFARLYVYSDSAADMGNCASDDEFLEQYRFLVRELFRLTKPGRLCAVHCQDIPQMKAIDGEVGIKNLTGWVADVHVEEGFVYHSRITIWKNPVVEMQRTKALGLLHKQLRKDSSMSRVGLPDYLLIFRKPGINAEPIVHTHKNFPVDQWQEWASPIWTTINQTRTLNGEGAREVKDERHVCPLQLDVIERAVTLWSNPGDIVLTPFFGIGSELYGALKLKRRGIGIELKESYWKQGCAFCAEAEASAATLFDSAAPLGANRENGRS